MYSQGIELTDHTLTIDMYSLLTTFITVRTLQLLLSWLLVVIHCILVEL